MKAVFNIAESNDKRYNIAFWTCGSIGVLTPAITIYFNVLDAAPKVFLSITLIGLAGIYIVRFLFNDYKKRGQLIIADKQISISLDNTSKILTNIKKIDFHYEGFFGAANFDVLPTKDGTKNIVTFECENENIEKVNIYLADREEKEKLIDALKIFSNMQRIKLELGLLVSF